MSIPDEKRRQAGSLWDMGYAFSEIAIQLDLTKGQVAGLRKREHWSPRVSIHLQGKRLRPPMDRDIAMPGGPYAHMSVADVERLPDRPPVPFVPNTQVVRAMAGPVVRLNAVCCWPIGEPGCKSFRFCDCTNVVPGKPYCVEHDRLAHQPRRSAAEAVAAE